MFGLNKPSTHVRHVRRTLPELPTAPRRKPRVLFLPYKALRLLAPSHFSPHLLPHSLLFVCQAPFTRGLCPDLSLCLGTLPTWLPLASLGSLPKAPSQAALVCSPAHQLCPRTFRHPHQTIGVTVGLLAWEADGDGRDPAQALNSRLQRFLEAAKAVLGGGPSQEAGVGTGKQNPPISHTPHHTLSAKLGRELGGARERGSVSSSMFWQIRLDEPFYGLNVCVPHSPIRMESEPPMIMALRDGALGGAEV